MIPAWSWTANQSWSPGVLIVAQALCEEVVRRRLAQVAADVTHWAEYDYVLVNDDLQVSLARTRAVLVAERLRRRRQPGLTEFVRQFRDPQR